MRAINNEEQLKELFKTGVRVGETVAINVGSDLEGTILVFPYIEATIKIDYAIFLEYITKGEKIR